MTGIKRIHYCDDFKFDFKRVDVDGNAVAVPTHQWHAVIHTPATEFRAWQDDKGIVGAKIIDEYTIRFILNAHGLQPGALVIEFVENIPDEDFPDGSRRVHRTYNTGIELVADSEASAPDGPVVTLMLPYIYETAYSAAVSAGYKGTEDEYMALASMLPDAVETAAKIQDSADSLADSVEQIGSAIETLGATTDAIEQGVNVIKDNADTLQESADKMGESAAAVNKAVEPLVQASESLDATKQAFEMLSSEWISGRQAIATALTNRRYPTEPTESFHAMAEKVENMSYEEGWFAKIGYTDENDGGIKEAIDYAYELAKGWNPDGSTPSLFEGNKDILFYPIVDTSRISNADRMFYGTSSLLFVPNLSLPKAISTNYMFTTSNVMKVGDIDIPNVTSMHSMFAQASKVTHIGAINSPMAIAMHYTLNATNIKYVKSVDVGSATQLNAFISSGILFICMKNIGKSTLTTYDFSGATSWGTDGEESRQSLIDSLITYSYDRASNGMATATIKLSATTKALLTEDEIAQITAKGFTIA
jgi:hypothetical protein